MALADERQGELPPSSFKREIKVDRPVILTVSNNYGPVYVVGRPPEGGKKDTQISVRLQLSKGATAAQVKSNAHFQNDQSRLAITIIDQKTSKRAFQATLSIEVPQTLLRSIHIASGNYPIRLWNFPNKSPVGKRLVFLRSAQPAQIINVWADRVFTEQPPQFAYWSDQCSPHILSAVDTELTSEFFGR
jgi:hypothetical protein